MPHYEDNLEGLPVDNDGQLAKIIYHHWMGNMKFTLDMEEHKFEKGREDSRFKFFKKMLMQDTYDRMKKVFSDLEELELIEPTKDSENLKNGYKNTVSGGSGYVNSKDFDDFLNE